MDFVSVTKWNTKLGAYTNYNHREGLAVLHPRLLSPHLQMRLAEIQTVCNRGYGCFGQRAKRTRKLHLQVLRLWKIFIAEIGLPVSLQDLGVNENTDLKAIADSCALMPGSYKK